MGPEQYYGYQQQEAYTQPDPDKKKRIFIVVGGLFVMLLLAIILLSILFSSPSVRQPVVKVGGIQNEVARVAEIGKKSREASGNTQKLAANIQIVSLTGVAAIRDWGKNLDQPITSASLRSLKNETNDEVLEEAGAQNRFDEEFQDAMLILLTSANDEIRKTAAEFPDLPNLQAVLNQIFENNRVYIDLLEA